MYGDVKSKKRSRGVSLVARQSNERTECNASANCIMRSQSRFYIRPNNPIILFELTVARPLPGAFCAEVGLQATHPHARTVVSSCKRTAEPASEWMKAAYQTAQTIASNTQLQTMHTDLITYKLYMDTGVRIDERKTRVKDITLWWIRWQWALNVNTEVFKKLCSFDKLHWAIDGWEV